MARNLAQFPKAAMLEPMPPWSMLLLLAAAGAAFWLIVRRATELFCVRIERGRPHHVRGRLPPALFSDIADVVRSPSIDAVELRVVSQGGEPRLLVSGELDEERIQRLRNVLGRFRTAQIRSGRRPPRRTRRAGG